jgi:Ca2+-binding RTX toxin-like protein
MATIWDPKGDGSNSNLNDLAYRQWLYWTETYDPGTNDTIFGMGGHDVITVHNGNDTVYGGYGDDVIVDRGGGNDTLYGQEGYDTFVAGTGVNYIDGGPGQDAVSYEASPGGVSVDLLSGWGYSNVYGGASSYNGADQLVSIENAHGSAFNDVIKGDDLANYLDGAGGHDRLEGRGGDDFLEGWTGQDILVGGAGNDTLLGGADRDILTGGDGVDRFLFTSTNDSASALYADVITDFTQGSLQGYRVGTYVWKSLVPGDKIDVGEIDARTDVAGNNAFAFIGQDAFSQSGQIRYFQADGNTYVQFNTNADAAPEMTLKLNGLHNLTGQDFIL